MLVVKQPTLRRGAELSSNAIKNSLNRSNFGHISSISVHSGTGTRTKIKTGPGPIIGTRKDREWDQSSGPEITETGTGTCPGPGPETFSGMV